MQNTILDDEWEESYSRDMAVLETLLMQDKLDAYDINDESNREILC